MKKGYSALYGFIPISFLLSILLTSTAFAGAYTPPSSSATATVHVSEACSLTSSVITPHTDNMSNGTSTESLGSTKFTVKCNDASGFALYAIGYSGDQYGATSMLGDNELSIPTGTDASAGNTTSHWSMKISKDTTSYLPNSLTIENSFGSQHLIPSTYTKIASFPSSTDGINGTGSSILATYGVRISGTQAAGTYIGKVKYTLVHPNMVNNENKPAEPLDPTLCPQNSICYVPNASDIIGSMSSLGSVSGSDKAGKQTNINGDGSAIISSNNEAVLIAQNFKREGYGFAGWSTDFEADNSSTIYGPNETITVPDVSSHGLILYPVWIASAGNLQGNDGQGWTGCSSLTIAPTNTRATLASMTALTDTRDNNVYAVARLADGKCWMVENLRLNAENSRGDANIAKAQGYGDATANNQGKFIGLADSEDANFTVSQSGISSSTNANSVYYASIQSGTATIDIFQTNYPAQRMPRYNNNNTNMSSSATNSDGSTTLSDSYSASNNHARWFGYGNYYSWSAAMANTRYYTTYSGTTGSDAAGTSICPKGWKLPLGNASTGDIEQGEGDTDNRVGSFSYLDRKLGGTGVTQSGDSGTAQLKRWLSFPNNFVRSGTYSTTKSSNRGNDGRYWSSSASDRYSAYMLNIPKFQLAPSSPSIKGAGLSVRCIAQ